jgi:phosphoserine phosphatase
VPVSAQRAPEAGRRVKNKTFSITINGDRWKFRIYSREEYEKKVGPDSSAATHPEKRLMSFHAEALSRGAIIHELFHAYCRSLYLESSNVARDDFEEIVAQMLEEKLDVIAEQATQMHKKMGAYIALGSALSPKK